MQRLQLLTLKMTLFNMSCVEFSRLRTLSLHMSLSPGTGTASAAGVIKKLHGCVRSVEHATNNVSRPVETLNVYLCDRAVVLPFLKNPHRIMYNLRYDFYRAIGSPTRIAAPMVDQSELPFRMLCRDYGAQLCFTPMLHARVALDSPSYLPKNFTTCKGDRPLIAQFCGNDPQTLLSAARLVEHAVDAVDVNLGCPQGIARRGHYGAYLLEETELIARIVSTLATGLVVPVTAKIRLLGTWDATLRLVLTLQSAGASMVTVHGRTREQNKERVLAADWDAIRRLKQHPSVKIPIVANGGIACSDDVDACLVSTTADGAMSSEALLEDPGLFSRRFRGSGVADDSFDIALRYLQYADEMPGADHGCIKAHLMRMLFGVWERLPLLRARLVARQEVDGLTNGFRDVVLAARSAYVAAFSIPWYLRETLPASSTPDCESKPISKAVGLAVPHSIHNAKARDTGSSDATEVGTAAYPCCATHPVSELTYCEAGHVFEGRVAPTQTTRHTCREATAKHNETAAEPCLACQDGDGSTHAGVVTAAMRRADLWQSKRRNNVTIGWANPMYGDEPAAPGRWYMRHRGDVYGLGKPAVVHGFEFEPAVRVKRGRSGQASIADTSAASTLDEEVG